MDDKIELLRLPFSKIFKEDEVIQALFDIDHFSYLISTNFGLYQFQDNQVIPLFRYPKGLRVLFARVKGESFELGTQKGLLIFDRGGEQRNSYYTKKTIYHITDDFVLSSRGVFHKENLISDKSFFSAYKKKNGDVLLAGRSGLCLFVKENLICNSMNQDTVFRVFEDSYKNLWASTSNGLKFFEHSTTRLISYIDGLSDNNVFTLELMDNQLFLGTKKGVNLLNFTTSRISLLDNTSDLHVTALKIFSGFLWIASENKGLFQYELKTGHRTLIKGLDMLVEWLSYADSKLWIGTQKSGIYVYDVNDNILKKHAHNVIEGQLKKITHCNNALYARGLKDFIQFYPTQHIVDKEPDSRYGVFTCHKNEIVIVKKIKFGHELQFLNKQAKPRKSLNLEEEILAIVSQGNALWTIQNSGISKWQHQARVANYALPSLKRLYRNRIVADHRYLFIGSAKGLLIIDTPVLEKIIDKPISVLADIDQRFGQRIIKTRISNLAQSKNFTLFFKYADQDRFMKLRRGEKIVIDESADRFVEIKALSGAYTTKPIYLDTLSGLDTRKPLVDSTHYPTQSTFVWINTILLILGSAMILRMYRRQVQTQSVNHQESTGALNWHDTTLVSSAEKQMDENDEKKSDILQDPKKLAKKLTEIEAGKTGALQSERRIIEFNRLIRTHYRTKNLRDNNKDYAKVLADKMGTEEQKLRSSLRHFFNSGSIHLYIKVYLEYLDTIETKRVK
ncbi:MAG: hypothetical protein AAGB12_07835 [Pseudomonadota bacterium]